MYYPAPLKNKVLINRILHDTHFSSPTVKIRKVLTLNQVRNSC